MTTFGELNIGDYFEAYGGPWYKSGPNTAWAVSAKDYVNFYSDEEVEPTGQVNFSVLIKHVIEKGGLDISVNKG
jgi:hypothetical protein